MDRVDGRNDGDTKGKSRSKSKNRRDNTIYMYYGVNNQVVLPW